MLSARELEPGRLPSNAQTWVNLHLFTHGDGVVMSPVTRKSAEGLPIFYLQDIPPVASSGPAVREPRIYFGQGTGSYVIVNGSTPEFDYPKGKDNVYGTYKGTGGVAVGGMARRTLFAWYFDDLNIFLTSYITSESRILFRRNIQNRVRTIAPFLRLDHDPYVVVSDGRLFWMQDAYTTSNWFPYAEPLPGGGANYIRNSVKVFIDAYNGSVDFYVMDPADPVIATYWRISPGCSSRSRPCQRICKSTSATRRTSSSSRPRCTAPITWTRLKSSTTGGSLAIPPSAHRLLRRRCRRRR